MNEDTPISEEPPQKHFRPEYTMAELLAKSDYTQAQPHDQREWVDACAEGRELL